MKQNKLKSRGASIWAKVSISPSKAHLIKPFLNYRSIKNPQNILFGNMNSKTNKKLTSIFISTNIRTPNKFIDIPASKKNVFDLKKVKSVNLIKTDRIPKKKMNYFQALGKYPHMNPLNDADKDGVLNMYDCKPFDRTKDAKSNFFTKQRKKNEQRKKDIEKANYFAMHPEVYKKYKEQFIDPKKLLEAEKEEKKNPQKAFNIRKELGKKVIEKKYGPIVIKKIPISKTDENIITAQVGPGLQQQMKVKTIENIQKSKEKDRFESLPALKKTQDELTLALKELEQAKKQPPIKINIKMPKLPVQKPSLEEKLNAQLERLKASRGMITERNIQIEKLKAERALSKEQQKQLTRLIHVATARRTYGKEKTHNPIAIIEPILKAGFEKERQELLRKPGLAGTRERLKAMWKGEMIPSKNIEKIVPIEKVEGIIRKYPMERIEPITAEAKGNKITLIYDKSITPYIDFYAREIAKKKGKEEIIKEEPEKLTAQELINVSKYNIPPPAVVYPVMEGISDIVSKKERVEQQKEEAAARRANFAEKTVKEVEKEVHKEKQEEKRKEAEKAQNIKAEELLKDKEVKKMIEKEKKERVKEIVEEAKAQRKAEKEAEILEKVVEKIEPEESSKTAQELINEA